MEIGDAARYAALQPAAIRALRYANPAVPKKELPVSSREGQKVCWLTTSHRGETRGERAHKTKSVIRAFWTTAETGRGNLKFESQLQ
jgi:hypothetical protein